MTSCKTAGSLCCLGTVCAQPSSCLLRLLYGVRSQGQPPDMWQSGPHGCELHGGIIKRESCKQEVKRVRFLLVTTHPAEKPGALYLSNLPKERLSVCLSGCVQGVTVKASRKPGHQNELTGNDFPTAWLLCMKRLFLFNQFHSVCKRTILWLVIQIYWIKNGWGK